MFLAQHILNPPVFIFTNLLKNLKLFYTHIESFFYNQVVHVSVQVWSWLESKLGDKAFRGERQTCNGVVEMFTASTRDATKDRVLVEFRDGKLHVVVASVPLGLV